jgi:valyl-tRNA synthetase
VLTTAREIITLWVSRMVMFNRYFLDGQLPFDDVFIHAMIQDGHGQKMSKSLGNGVDPRDIIHGHGADAMRFTLVQMTTDTQDVRMPVDLVCPHTGEAFAPEMITTTAGHVVAAPIQSSPGDPSKQMVSAYGVAAGVAEPTDEMPLARNTSAKFDLGRNFANKVWNATRFALKRVDGTGGATDRVDMSTRPFADRWIVTRLAQTVTRLERSLADYQFNVFADTLYDFVWHDVCDRYLEMIKPTIDDDHDQQVVLVSVLDAVLRIMHPVCPFVTEALWPHVGAARCGDVAGLELPAADLAAGASWPAVDAALDDGEAIELWQRADQLIGAIRTVRGSQSVAPRTQITVHAPAATIALVGSVDGVVEVLAGVGELHELTSSRPHRASPITFEGSEILLSGLVDDVDLDQERDRLRKIIEGKTKQIAGFNGRLSNEGFLTNAKPEIVADTRSMLTAAEADLAAAETALANLG